MRYYLKKDLPGVKAGTEMEKVIITQTKNTFENGHIFRPGQTVEIVDSVLSGVWKGKDKNDWHRIPESETSEWIEERDGKWMPKNGDVYFMPDLEREDENPVKLSWSHHPYDERIFARHLCCSTKEQAIALAEHLIQAAKEWQEKRV